MNYWGRFISTVGGARFILVLGGLFVAFGAGRAILLWTAGGSIAATLVEFVLIGGPGLGLLYGGYQLPHSNLRPDVHPRVAAWCLGAAGVMLGVVGLLVLNPGGNVNRPFRAALIATALGSSAGLANGINNAQAISRARDAEQHRDDLRQERDLRERIVETSPIGIVVVNVDGSIENVNEHAAEIVGIPQDQLTELSYDEPMFTEIGEGGNLPDDSLFERILTTGESVYRKERQIARANKERIWLSVNGAPLHDVSGELTAVIFAFEDITERKRLETELKATVDRLEQSNDRLRQFAYAASHDLQEPLRMVSSYLQLLENRYKDDLDSDAREFIEFAVDGADRMREMVQDLLAYSRIQQGDPEFASVDCDAVVERVLTDLQIQIEEADADVVTEPLPTVEADANHLEQLFQNLISNALKYSDEQPRVEIVAEQRTDHWDSRWPTTGSGSSPTGLNRSSRCSSDSITTTSIRGRASGFRSAKRSSRTTTGRFGSSPSPAKDQPFTLPSPSPRRNSQHPSPDLRPTANKLAAVTNRLSNLTALGGDWTGFSSRPLRGASEQFPARTSRPSRWCR